MRQKVQGANTVHGRRFRNRTLTFASAFSIAFIQAVTVAAQSEPPPTTPAPDATTPSGSASQEPSTENKDAAAQAKEAISTQQQIPALRGGTLGIPSPVLSEGLQAMAGSQSAVSDTSDKKVDFDFFTKIGGLTFFRSDKPCGADPLDLSDCDARQLQAEIIAERYRQNVPWVQFSVPALPKMVLTNISDIGLRVRFVPSTSRWIKTAVKKPTQADGTVAGAAARSDALGKAADALYRGRSGSTFSVGLRFLQRSLPDTNITDFNGIAGELTYQHTRVISGRIRDCAKAITDKAKDDANEKARQADEADAAVDEARKAHEAATSFKEHAIGLLDNVNTLDATKLMALTLAQSQFDAKVTETANTLHAAQITAEAKRLDAAKSQASAKDLEAAVETAAEKGALDKNPICDDGHGYRLMLFVSLSGTHLASVADDSDAMVGARYVSFSESRLTAGFEFQTRNEISGNAVFPRIGAYSTISNGFWTNEFANIVPREVTSFQLETAVYISGHFFDGFSGLLSFGVVKPYGHDERFEYLINVVPSIGANLGGG